MSAKRGEAGLASVLELKLGWNSYNSPPITPAAIDATRRFMQLLRTSAPYVVPMSNGGIQIEWHEGGFDCEIEISPDGTVQPLDDDDHHVNFSMA